jgi:hypothetical protein
MILTILVVVLVIVAFGFGYMYGYGDGVYEKDQYFISGNPDKRVG